MRSLCATAARPPRAPPRPNPEIPHLGRRAAAMRMRTDLRLLLLNIFIVPRPTEGAGLGNGTRRQGGPWICPPPDAEPLLRSIIGGLFAEGLVRCANRMVRTSSQSGHCSKVGDIYDNLMKQNLLSQVLQIIASDKSLSQQGVSVGDHPYQT